MRRRKDHLVYKYRLSLWWSDEDQAFLVEVPELPGAMADGATPEEAVRNAQEVIANWIAFAREHGRDVPEPQPADLPASV
jgi:predicted RNase H-like HicB family nuclease